MCREDVSNNLTLAVAPDDFKDESELDANDFLIRGIIGMDPKGGAIAVGETVGVGKRIRFMVGPNHYLYTWESQTHENRLCRGLHSMYWMILESAHNKWARTVATGLLMLY